MKRKLLCQKTRSLKIGPINLLIGFTMLLVVGVATACIPLNNGLGTESPGSSPTTIALSNSSTPTQTGIATWTPSEAINPTLTPSRIFIPTLTPSIVPSQIWTLLPTLSSDQAKVQMLEWIRGLVDCSLPCWAGITPGITSWQEAKQLLGTAVIFGSIKEPTNCTFGLCNEIQWHSRSGFDFRGIITSNSQGIFNWIVIEPYTTVEDFRIDQVLSQYGRPNRIFISTWPSALDYNAIQFDIVLAYLSQEFILKYTWVATKSGDNILGCIQDGHIYLSISNRINSQWTNDQIKQEVYGMGDIGQVVFKPLEDVTDKNVDSFYQEFKVVKDNECISTPAQYWP